MAPSEGSLQPPSTEQEVQTTFDGFPVDTGVFYVGMHESVTREEVEKLFSRAGKIVSVRAQLHKGRVFFADAATAKRAKSLLHHSHLYGNQLGVMLLRDVMNKEKHDGPVDPNTATIYFERLPETYTGEELVSIFKVAGEIIGHWVPTNSDGSGKGYGQVEFEKPEDARRACEMFGGQVMAGKKIKVIMHDPRDGGVDRVVRYGPSSRVSMHRAPGQPVPDEIQPFKRRALAPPSYSPPPITASSSYAPAPPVDPPRSRHRSSTRERASSERSPERSAYSDEVIQSGTKPHLLLSGLDLQTTEQDVRDAICRLVGGRVEQVDLWESSDGTQKALVLFAMPGRAEIGPYKMGGTTIGSARIQAEIILA